MTNYKKKILFGSILLLVLFLRLNAVVLDGTSNVEHKDFFYQFGDGDLAKGFVRLNQGFSISPGGTITLDIVEPIPSPVKLFGQNTTLRLKSNLCLESDTVLTSSRNRETNIIEGLGHILFLDGNLTLTNHSDLRITSSLIIDGRGHSLILEDHARLLIDEKVTLTLRNLTFKNVANSREWPQIRVAGGSPLEGLSRLALENVELACSSDFTFSNAQLFIHDDVVFSGTSEFVYGSSYSSFVAPGASFCFEQGTGFFYEQQNSTNNDLIIMQDELSTLFFDGSTLRTTETGLRLSRGRLFFDNKVSITSYKTTPNRQVFGNSIIFGDSSRGMDYDLDIYVLAGAQVEVDGLVKFDNIN